MKKILILFFLIMSSCGYQPLYKTNKFSENFKIQKVELIGDTNISKKILSKLPLVKDKNNEILNKLIIESKKNIVETSKNSKGQITSYRTVLNVSFKLLDYKNNIISKKILVKEFSYNTDENKFQLKEYQNRIEKNLIDRIVEDLIIHLNS